MHTGFIFSRFLTTEKRRYFILSLLWLVGLLLGICLAAPNAAKYDPVIYTALIQKPSFIQMALVNCFVLIAIAFLRFRKYYLAITPIILLLSFSRGFSGMTLYVLLGSGAWSVRSLFLFSGICVSVITWWLLLRQCDSRPHDLVKTLGPLLITVLVISIADYFVISPFLASITQKIF